METTCQGAVDIGSSKFKSYYVVWKLYYINNKTLSYYKFKSYYVVWKPYVMKYVTKEFAKFKSYYVVWKLLSPVENRQFFSLV